MDQADTLGHRAYSAGGAVSDASTAPGRISDFQSEDMDTTAQPSEVESYSDRPMTSQDARFCHSGPDSDWGEGESEVSRHRRQYPKILPYVIPTEQVQNRWYQGEDLMDPRKVASPACRVGRPNVDGSIGGDKGHPLPPNQPNRQYFHDDRELCRRVTYPHAERDTKGKCSPITEQERLKRAKC